MRACAASSRIRDDLIGTRLGPYEITAKLGEGGMGEVFRAHDSRLDRDVALKILPSEVGAEPERLERFRSEARALAALDHPGIVTIYSVEEADGVHFLTMQLVDGQSLDRLVLAGGLTSERILELALGLAEGVAAAHAKGIVHRDLKPANVMVTADGRVKVLDFGLAKVTAGGLPSAKSVTHLQTSEGAVMGTMPYMSPEQVTGQPVDARTDIFALGVVLYELASGQRPFEGRSAAELVSSILRDAPRPLAELRSDLPAGYASLVERCLRKSIHDRVQTAGIVRDELRALRGLTSPHSGADPDSSAAKGTAAGAPKERSGPVDARPSLVVLPFANLSPDAENEYFSDGLTEEIIADLAQVRALRVISRTSSMQLKGAHKDVRTIGRELGVRYVLEGGVRKAGNSLRITAQLVDAATDANLWGEKFSGTLDDVFELQERVSREIVRALDVKLTSDEHRRLAERPIADARAFELYLQARQELRRYAPERAAGLIHEAMRIEGETPPLLAQLASVKVMQMRAGVGRDRALLDEAEHEALRLLARVPDASYGHALLGQVEYERGNMPGAVHHCKRALERAPNDSDTLFTLLTSYIGAGQNAEARGVARRMVASDPLSPFSWVASGLPYWFVGEPERAIPDHRRALELDPRNLILNWCIGYTYALVGRLADAARHAQVLAEVGPDVPYTRQLLALIDGLEGRRQAALDRIVPLDVAPLDAHHRFHLAESFVAAGDLERGADLLEQAIEGGFYPYPFIDRHCPFLEPLRALPRFATLRARAQMRVEAFRES